jgi:hypothetical protein
MNSLQLDFFKSEEECEFDTLRIFVNQIKNSTDKVRKGTYARINSVEKDCVDLKTRLEIIERHICKGC